MRSASYSIVLKAVSLIFTFCGLCLVVPASDAMTSSVPLTRRPTPTRPPVPSKPISVIGDEAFAQIQSVMELQSNDETRVAVAFEAAQFLATTGSNLTVGQTERLAALATSEAARTEILNQFESR